MKITTNMDVNTQKGVLQAQENKPVNKNEKANTPEKAVEVSFSSETNRNKVLSDEELQCAIENVLASQSSVYDVEQAEKMIAEANRNILANSNEAVLSQANQTPPMVTELTQ